MNIDFIETFNTTSILISLAIGLIVAIIQYIIMCFQVRKEKTEAKKLNIALLSIFCGFIIFLLVLMLPIVNGLFNQFFEDIKSMWQ